MLVNKYFTKDEIIETMENAEEYGESNFDSLFEAMFNRDYYIIGTYEASEALGTYKNDERLDGYKTNLDGLTGAAVLVERYELNQCGNILTPLDDPEKLANMVEYIRGETLFDEALNKANIDMFEAPTKENLEKFIEAAKKL